MFFMPIKPTFSLHIYFDVSVISCTLIRSFVGWKSMFLTFFVSIQLKWVISSFQRFLRDILKMIKKGKNGIELKCQMTTSHDWMLITIYSLKIIALQNRKYLLYQIMRRYSFELLLCASSARASFNSIFVHGGFKIQIFHSRNSICLFSNPQYAIIQIVIPYIKPDVEEYSIIC